MPRIPAFSVTHLSQQSVANTIVSADDAELIVPRGDCRDICCNICQGLDRPRELLRHAPANLYDL